jgi:DNA-binding LacI/PurR family transcriptional regulator
MRDATITGRFPVGSTMPVEQDLADESGSDPEQVAGPLKRILALSSPSNNIFCLDDLVGRTADDVLESWRIDVQGQLSLVGFDGLQSWLFGKGHLTTPDQYFLRIGKIFAHLVLDHVFGRALSLHQQAMMLAAQLLALDSSGPVPLTNTRFANLARAM